MKRNLIAILGPTASGKSTLGVALAKKFNGVILSADSRQVYRGMDIGTAKIKKSEMRGVPHFLLDIVSPKRTFTVARFQRAAAQVLKRIPLSVPVFIVGGSPFYIDAILTPIPFPDVPPNPALRKRLAKKTTSYLFHMVQRKDPRRARMIDRNNPRRLIRALEIVSALGRVPPRNRTKPHQALKIGIAMPRIMLYRRIDARVDERVPGMLKETAKLHDHGIPWKRLGEFGLEYRWASRILTGRIQRQEGIMRLKGDIHAFSRRQTTWWRNDASIRWIKTRRSAERIVSKYITK